MANTPSRVTTGTKVTWPPQLSLSALSAAATDKETIGKQSRWVHPHLIESIDPIKGRQLRASQDIPAGTCILIDCPYAIIPVVDNPATSEGLLCSNRACNRALRAPASRVVCSKSCLSDVAWCSTTCRDSNMAYHNFECSWLKRYAVPIRKKWGEYVFGMSWVIVRLLASQHVERTTRLEDEGVRPTQEWKCDWRGVESLCGSVDSWSHEQVRSWTLLVKKYLQKSAVLPHDMTPDQVLHLICQEEANSFGLYPRETGIYPCPEPPMDRGEQYAAAVYPIAAMANHSCIPNMMHKPDESGRMIFTASQDILAGQECCISYFDLTEHINLTSRREHLRKSFRFTCQCDRCTLEAPAQNSSDWSAMPLMDI
ncbi:Uncharacterized protein PECH_005786 [Penicillium ucsense]|uniref:SET domain-containing protein n=1 Tax=Penicillium ucsense TaxID=2839758 RepID=A0A8J8W885_9EURO|nr:Uncharacterized protein PECM_003239 [Penicillium ucsense]KAF7736089.1 Uncharacterized protein PECH_005786 [Penicillium ucsense]